MIDFLITKNLLFGKSWDLSGVSFDGNIFTFSSGGLSMASCSMNTPQADHIYYGGCFQKAPEGSSFPDRRFEWYKSDNQDEVMTFAQMEDTGGEWKFFASRIKAPSSPSDTWVFRNFTVNATAESYRKGLVLIDLTEVFGEGNEPEKDWLDENITFITDEFVSFSEVNTDLTKRRRIMMGSQIGGPLYFYKSEEGTALSYGKLAFTNISKGGNLIFTQTGNPSEKCIRLKGYDTSSKNYTALFLIGEDPSVPEVSDGVSYNQSGGFKPELAAKYEYLCFDLECPDYNDYNSPGVTGIFGICYESGSWKTTKNNGGLSSTAYQVPSKYVYPKSTARQVMKISLAGLDQNWFVALNTTFVDSCYAYIYNIWLE